MTLNYIFDCVDLDLNDWFYLYVDVGYICLIDLKTVLIHVLQMSVFTSNWLDKKY